MNPFGAARRLDDAFAPTSPREAWAYSNYVVWDQSKCFAWDRSNALKRELRSTAKALTLVDNFVWDQSKR
jgi:hypothetical protein